MLKDSFSHSTANIFSSGCPSGYFQCITDKKCIPETQKCNKQADCMDGSDEFDCSKYGYIVYFRVFCETGVE